MTATTRTVRILSVTDEPPDLRGIPTALFLLSGPRHSGKTTAAQAWIKRWKEQGHTVSGILARSEYRDGALCGYNIVDLSDSFEYPLVRATPFPGGTRQGRFHFDSVGFTALEDRILRRQWSDIFVIDEIGPLELEHRNGWIRLLEASLTEPSGHILLVVRDAWLAPLLHHCHPFVGSAINHEKRQV